MSELDPVAVARQLADALEEAGIPYAVGGAIAYGYFGPPRGTHDADLNVFLGPDRAEPAFDALERGGMVFDRVAARRQIAGGGHVRGLVDTTPVDIFFDSIPLHEDAARRAVIRPLAGRPAKVLSAEDTVLFKMLFHRGKDVIDVERLVRLMGSELDHAYIRAWLVECVGDDDHRIREWDQMVRELGA